MLKEIKIIDNDGIEIQPDKKKFDYILITPGNGKNLIKIIKGEKIDDNELRNLQGIIQGQLNILEAQKLERKTGCGKYKEHSTCKTGCTTGGTE